MRRGDETASIPAMTVVVDSVSANIGDPLQCLLALRDVVGERNAFLLESLAGPTVDTRSSMIGITGLLEIEVFEGLVVVRGEPELCDRTRRVLRDTGLVLLGEDPTTLQLVREAALWDIPRAIRGMFDVEVDASSFGFGLLTYFGYDAVHYIEQLPRSISDPEPMPDAVFVLVRGLITVDLRSSEAHLTLARSDSWRPFDDAAVRRAIAAASASSAPAEPETVPAVPAPDAVHDEMTEAQYVERAEACLDRIRVGDIYQVQIGHEMRITTSAEHVDVYRRLRARNPSPYMCVLPIADSMVVGASPELFVRVEGRSVTMRPIAGTARRTGDAVLDEVAVDGLRSDPKERAEHIMLVDLCRNDLGRIAAAGTVRVQSQAEVETYSHMFHLVSSVTAELDDGLDVMDVIPAGFPAGTMTGAPKIRSMEIIEAMELSRRGLYAGSFGLVGFGGWSVLGLAIRMAVHRDGEYRIRASAGIVADSVPADEWRETRTKLAAVHWAITGQELR